MLEFNIHVGLLHDVIVHVFRMFSGDLLYRRKHPLLTQCERLLGNESNIPWSKHMLGSWPPHKQREPIGVPGYLQELISSSKKL